MIIIMMMLIIIIMWKRIPESPGKHEILSLLTTVILVMKSMK